MNIISHSHAYSLFPRGTFESKSSLVVVRKITEGTRRALEKYHARGWRIQYSRESEDVEVAVESSRAFQLGERWVDDKQTWVLPLDMTGVVLPQLDAMTDNAETVPEQLDFTRLHSWDVTQDFNGAPRFQFAIFAESDEHSQRTSSNYLTGSRFAGVMDRWMRSEDYMARDPDQEGW